jgi:transcription-repair coupling factor (superfamily II helicase)
MELDLLLRALELPGAAAPRRTWAELHGGALRLAAAEAAARHSGPVCVIAVSAAEADKLEREMAFFGPRPTRRFPDYETLPYEPISPPQDLLADRLLALNRLARGEPETLVLEAGALLERLPQPEFIVSRSLHLATGDRFDPVQMTKRLSEHGYLRVEQVAEPGEFAVRGAVFDIFPTGSSGPVRVDLFDDEIETLRTFDAQTQLSAGKTDRIEILPAREFPFDEAAIKFFRERFREHFPVEPGRCPVYRTISDAQLPAGIEYYLPLFFKTTASLFDYLPASTLFVVADGALDALETSWQLVCER